MEPDRPAQIPAGYITRQSTQIIANGHCGYRADSINTPENTFPDRSQTGTTACCSTRSTGPGHQHHLRGRTAG
jgi:hypothetical protein